jgi:hypothetical protein
MIGAREDRNRISATDRCPGHFPADDDGTLNSGVGFAMHHRTLYRANTRCMGL